MLYIFAGLPGTGKSTLAQRLARAQQAVHLRIDTIEQSLREVGCLINGPEGYVVAYRLAADNLRLGLPVVADSVNPLQVTTWKVSCNLLNLRKQFTEGFFSAVFVSP